jgi:hypothetical protein
MVFRLKACTVALAAVVAVSVLSGLPRAYAEGITHMVSGVVKKVDKDTKTMVVKTADGTEHTVKYTDKTVMEGGKDVESDVKEGSKVSVKYTEEGGEKTAVGVKDVGKDVGKGADKM